MSEFGIAEALHEEFDEKPKARESSSMAARYARTLAGYRYDPLGFVEDIIGATPDEWQRDALIIVGMMVRDEIPQRKLSVAAATGVGKDAFAAWLALWFEACFDFAKGMATAPSASLLDDVLWSEIHKWLRHARALDTVLEWRATELRHRSHPAEWFMSASVAGVRYSAGGVVQVEGLSGRHAENMLLIVDEASGVVSPVFDALEGTMTGANNILVVLGNPVRIDGRFFEIHNNPTLAEHWVRLHVAALGAEYEPYVARSDTGKKYIGAHASEENARGLISAYGLESPIVQARVFGNFPILASHDTAFTYAEVMAAMTRSIEPSEHDEVQIGVDCARFGDDETVFMIRRGRSVRFETLPMSDGIAIAGHIARLCDLEVDLTRPHWQHMPLVLIDGAEAGGGASAFDILRSNGFENVFLVDFGSPSRRDDLYKNVAAEMWLGELVAEMPTLAIQKDERLLQQLTTRKYEFTGFGAQRRLEKKDKMKKRGLRSPDRADALCLAVHRLAIPRVL